MPTPVETISYSRGLSAHWTSHDLCSKEKKCLRQFRIGDLTVTKHDEKDEVQVNVYSVFLYSQWYLYAWREVTNSSTLRNRQQGMPSRQGPSHERKNNAKSPSQTQVVSVPTKDDDI